MPSGTTSFLQIQSARIKAATEIPSTATSPSNPKRAASGTSTSRSEGSASLPVTKRMCSLGMAAGHVLPYCAAVAVDDLPGQVRGGVAGKKPRETGHIFRLAPALQRSLAADSLLPGIAGCLTPSGLDPSGRNAVDSHHRREADCQRSCKPHDRV